MDKPEHFEPPVAPLYPAINEPPPAYSRQPRELPERPAYEEHPRAQDYRPTTYTVQPGINQFCPPGLEILSEAKGVYIKQQVEVLEALIGWETNNRYVVLNEKKQQIFYAVEKTGTCQRICCGSQRGFTLHILDAYGTEIMRISRPFKCCGGLFLMSCCAGNAYETMIEAPPGRVIGNVTQRQSCFHFRMAIQDESGADLFHTTSDCCTCPCVDVDFPIRTVANEEVGLIQKKWSGCCKETFTDADNFRIDFPREASIKTKATIIGAAFLIDFAVFENK